MPPVTDSSGLSEEIDQLLEHYLALLDQYTALRSQLSSLQSSFHQHIARANFSAERGIRYGPNFYDARMQATRLCSITVPSLDGDTSTTARPQQERRAEGEQTLNDVAPDPAPTSSRTEKEGLKGGMTSTAARRYTDQEAALKWKSMDTAYFRVSTAPTNVQDKEVDGASAAGGDKSERTKMAPKDPLRMFGLLTSPSLRLAQTESIKTVEEVVPQLVSIDTEMKEVEIRIRRARKWKAKAETQEGKAVENAGDKEFERIGDRQEVVI